MGPAFRPRLGIGVLALLAMAVATPAQGPPPPPPPPGFGVQVRPAAALTTSEDKPAAPGTGLILGRVIDALTNRPIANAIVNIASSTAIPREVVVAGGTPSGPVRRMVTNDDGRFVFAELNEGLYTINGAASGYLSGAYGQRRPQSAAQPLILAKDQRMGDVTIRLWKEGTIGGTITDEVGEPVVGVTVSLLRRSETTGRWPPTAYSSGRTDDRGVYRISGLLSGRFFVVVSSSVSSTPLSAAEDTFEMRSGFAVAGGGMEMNAPARTTATGIQVGDDLLRIGASNAMSLLPTARPDGTVVGYRNTFYPNATTSARATLVFLTPGEERSGIDIQLRPMAMARVSGTLLGPNGPASNFSVRLVPAEVDAAGGSEGPFDVATTTTNPSGGFSFLGVPPGAFVLKATRQPAAFNGPNNPSSEPALWAEMPVTVGEAPVLGLALNLRPAPTISGRVEFEGTGPRPAPNVLQGLSISLAVADGRPQPCCAQSRIATAGDFTIPSFYLPGKYYPNVSTISGWSLKSVTSGGADILRAPLVISGESVKDVVVTLVDKVSDIRGRITGADGKIDPTASVLMFPADYQLWIREGVNTRVVRLSRPAPQTGAYSFLNVIPGDYLIAAAPDDDLPLWQDPAVIEAAARVAMRVTVAPGEKKTLDLSVRPLQ